MSAPRERAGPTGPVGRSDAIELWLACATVLAWVRWPSPWWLALGAVAVGAWTLRRRSSSPVRAVAAATLLGAIVGGFVATHGLRRVETDWPAFRADEISAADRHLDAELNRLLARGDSAVARVARVASEGLPSDRQLRRGRRSGELATLALYDERGIPLVWDGVHQGEVPEAARTGEARYVYAESPLFGYLYFTAPVGEGEGTVVGAALLREELPGTLASAEPTDFASRFHRRYDESIRFLNSGRAGAAALWDLVWDGQPLVSVEINEPSQADRRAGLLLDWGRRLAALVLIAWLLLVSGERREERGRWLAASVGVLALVVPLGSLTGLEPLFSPADFMLPGPATATLGRSLAVAAAVAFLLGMTPTLRPRGRPWLTVLTVGVAFPLVLGWLGRAASTTLLATSEASWVAYETLVAVTLSCIALVAIPLGRTREAPRERPLLLALAAVLSLLLAGAVALGIRRAGVELWGLSFLWSIPAGIAAMGLPAVATARRSVVVAVLAAVLGGSAAVCYTWADRTAARMAVAEDQLDRLGTPVDTYLEFLLERLGTEARSVQEHTSRPIELLYESWARSGLAREGYPLWLTLWTTGPDPREELPIGVSEARPPIADEYVDTARREGTIEVRRFDMRDVHYLATIPLLDGWVITAVVPPRRELLSTSPLGPLFSSVERTSESPPLSLVPIPPSMGAPDSEPVRWTPSEVGFDADRVVLFPESPYAAHYGLELPGLLLLTARGTLLVLLSMLAFVLLTGLGSLARSERRALAVEWRSLLGSFRFRVTMALFAFFLLSTAVIGTFALRTLAGATDRTATALAQRDVGEAASNYGGFEGELQPLARQVGADLVLYADGQLTEGAVHELVELGIYPGLLPLEVHRVLGSGDAVSAAEPGLLGRWPYVMGYQRLARNRVLASPTGLEAGALALGRREAADLLGFAIVLGAALSFGLALLVARTLTRPIHSLQVASERVGSGNLSVQLPDTKLDEFDAVFEAFNRMVQSLSATRDELVRNTRRTEAIVEEAATGVVAVDPGGEVLLVNPGAEMLLGVDVPVFARLPEQGAGLAAEFRAWVDRFFRDGIPEGATEFQLGERRIRVRGRRVSRSEPFGGAVFSLEDVTDELRAERVLAWGEMAQQVAHEVKNPLTPIKLGVQHIRRAWRDRAPDFDAVVERNVESVLGEIDRLAEIAGSFSRFSAPTGGEVAPLEPVDVSAVLDEVLALYRGGSPGIRFDGDVDADLPLVRARVGELKEVLINLLENARDASEDGAQVLVRVVRASGGRVEVSVVDEGTGIGAEDLSRIFLPHFSTRSSGTGLGLAIVMRLVESWGGEVSVESAVGAGTTMTLTLGVWSADPDG